MTKPRMLLAGVFAALAAIPVFAIEDPSRTPSVSEEPPQDSSPHEVVRTAPSAENPQPDVSVAATPAPQPAASIWERIRSGFALPEIESALVARHEAWFLNHPDYTLRMIERSRLYLYYIVEEVEKRGMPMEIALLPMIESGYNPGAYSRAHAAGIWQFIPSTGRRYGLQQDWWYDGRRDVLAATRAALDYLEKLHAQFDDWPLALAAYNWGENGVARAIAHNRSKRKPTDYRSLRMPRETRNYLPKLQAVRNIIANPQGVGFPLEDIPDQPYFTTVTTPEHIDMQVAARLAEMSEDDFRSLNPGHTRPVITSNGSRTLLLPIDKAGIFNANLKDYDQPLVSWQTYTLKKHETLEQVAGQFGISTARLKEINGINRHLTVPGGRTLLVPMNEETESSNLMDTWENPEFLAPDDYYMNRMVYRVKSGDSLYSIARANRISVAALKEWNRLRGNNIRPGQHLTIYSNPRAARR
ncbi:MAG TPA: transglycosylase SLT domain-containing protein [Burkholderiales bacterium]|nr:transglycosylase SLT domain-containing protein [Burkholderiales bacterium]